MYKRQEYERIFERACADEGIVHDESAFGRLVNTYHRSHGRPLLACYPRDLLHLVASRARYLGVAAELSPDLLDWAWHGYFGNEALIEAASESGSAA